MADHSVIRIVYMGDSITEGQYVDASFRWTELVTANIRIHFEPEENERLFFFNKGISGETTRQGLERYPRDVQSFAPRFMTLQFGLNDCNCWDTDKGHPRVSEAAYRANLLEMIDRSRLFGVETLLLLTSHPTLRHTKLISGETLDQRRIKYNKIVRSVAEESSTLLCDIEKHFDGLTKPELSELLLPEPDVLHLSLKGHIKYADAIFESLLVEIKKIMRGNK